MYEHKVQYYETDQMKVVHHSNYIRWFEEARTAWMEERGFAYDRLEKLGVISPVISVEANYLSMTKYGDKVNIETKIQKYNGVRLEVEYVVKDQQSDEVRCTGISKHCFLDSNGRVLKLSKISEECHQMFLKGLLESNPSK